MNNDRKDSSHWLTKEEIAAEERQIKISMVMQITGRSYLSEASDILSACRRMNVDLSDTGAVNEVAKDVIKQRESAGMLPSGQPCI